MSLILNNTIRISPLSLKTGITVWQARIPEIIQSICCKGTYHNFQAMVNEIFQKNDFLPAFLNPVEIDTLNNFKALKKQIEWVCGRYLLKEMVKHQFLKNLALDEIFIDYHEQGAPYIKSAPDIPISLSHSNKFTVAACAADKTLCFGIDIEKIAKKPDASFLKIAFSKNEIQNLEDDAAQIYKNWTIKEAYLKYIKKGFNESLHKVEIIQDAIFHHGEKMDLDVSSVFIDGYALSLVSDR